MIYTHWKGGGAAVTVVPPNFINDIGRGKVYFVIFAVHFGTLGAHFGQPKTGSISSNELGGIRD